MTARTALEDRSSCVFSAHVDEARGRVREARRILAAPFAQERRGEPVARAGWPRGLRATTMWASDDELRGAVPAVDARESVHAR